MRSAPPRVELQEWYLQHLQPKLAHAARTGVVDPHAAAVCDAQVRRFLDIAPAASEFG